MDELSYHVIHVYLHLFALPSEVTTKELVFLFNVLSRSHHVLVSPETPVNLLNAPI